MQGQTRVYISSVYPEIDVGKFPIKRVVGEKVKVEATIFADGHDLVRASLLYRHESEKDWRAASIKEEYEDHYSGEFQVERQGTYYYTIEAWIDHALSWQHSLRRRLEGKEKIFTELLTGAEHLKKIISVATKKETDE